MTIDNVLEILEKHKLRIPSNVFYELKADIVNFEEPTTKNDLSSELEKNSKKLEKNFGELDCISRDDVWDVMQELWGTSGELIDRLMSLPSVTPQEPILDRVRAEIQDNAFDWQEIDGEHESFMVVDLNDALNIIDKYKVESEET